MGVVLNTNTSSLFVNRALRNIGHEKVSAAEKLSTGSRLNNAGDDGAGLSISAKINSKIRGVGSAQQNIMNAIGVVDHTQAGLFQVLDELQSVRELAIQAYNGN